jgi:hypothetical protein
MKYVKKAQKLKKDQNRLYKRRFSQIFFFFFFLKFLNIYLKGVKIKKNNKKFKKIVSSKDDFQKYPIF